MIRRVRRRQKVSRYIYYLLVLIFGAPINALLLTNDARTYGMPPGEVLLVAAGSLIATIVLFEGFEKGEGRDV